MSNHLKNATSPYLLQHAENPVDWYPWCKQAFEKAKSEDKPIFLSIGYSTCHWCHVMAHESFEDKKTAEILNQYFVSIKIDREERPDIDSVYMSVCQAFTGSGGWPMSIFMTWDKKPFFAGTYFPPKSHYGMPPFRICRSVFSAIFKASESCLCLAYSIKNSRLCGVGNLGAELNPPLISSKLSENICIARLINSSSSIFLSPDSALFRCVMICSADCKSFLRLLFH